MFIEQEEIIFRLSVVIIILAVVFIIALVIIVFSVVSIVALVIIVVNGKGATSRLGNACSTVLRFRRIRFCCLFFISDSDLLFFFYFRCWSREQR